MLLRRRIREAAPKNSNTPSGNKLGDVRFRKLLAKEEWEALPPAIRRRFSKRLSGGATALYAGEVVETKITRVGWLFAHAARLVGAPLPLSIDAHAPAVVSVTEDAASGGQNWTRVYARRSGFPQVIHSCKRFEGETGLAEHVGGGVGMALTVHEAGGALQFRSARYFLKIGALRLTLPLWLTPGALTVTHAEDEGERFIFLLEIVHPVFGLIIRQFSVFKEVAS